MSQENNIHCCPTYPCPVCSKVFPTDSAWVQPQLELWTPTDPPKPESRPQEKIASIGDLEDLTNILNQLEASVKAADVRHLIFDAQDIVGRMRNDCM